MTALPSNLALVGEDLARATLRDARRSARQRRLATYAIAFALLLALTATAAIANGWLLDETPTVKAVPALGDSGGGDSHTLLTGLGPHGRVLSSYATAGGGVCLVLTGFWTQCVPTLRADQEIAWYLGSPSTDTTVIFGIVRDDVTGVDAVFSDGRTTAAQVGNDGFYLEAGDGTPTQLVVHLSNGSSDAVTLLPCPATAPDCGP